MKYRWLGILAFGLITTACVAMINETGGSTPPTIVAESDDARYEFGEAVFVDSISTDYPETSPDELQIIINGHLPDGCTEIDEVSYTREEMDYSIQINTRREVGIMCTTALEPFEVAIMLDTGSLDRGDYSVKAYEKEAIFTVKDVFESTDGCG